MTPVSLEKLESAIIKPGLEEKLVPLVAYRGNMTLGRAHRLLNLTISGMEQDCELADLTQRLQHNPDYSHLCGPDKRAQYNGLCGFFGRLEDNPEVANNIPHLLDYVRGLGGFRFSLERVSPETGRRRNVGAGGWREFVGKPKKEKADKAISTPPRPALVYPFLIHDGGRAEHDLLRKVNAAIPQYYSPDRRADMCQDLIVGILSGDFSEDDLGLPAKEMTKRVMQMFPTKYGPVSLDADLTGDGFRLIDTLSDDMNPWEMMETM